MDRKLVTDLCKTRFFDRQKLQQKIREHFHMFYKGNIPFLTILLIDTFLFLTMAENEFLHMRNNKKLMNIYVNDDLIIFSFLSFCRKISKILEV